MAEDPKPKDSKRTTNVPDHVGYQMRVWRESAGMSLDAVAEKLHCRKGHLSQVENGKGNLSIPLFLAYCKAIGTPPNYILGDEIMKKDADFFRLAKELRDKIGLAELKWLSGLDQELVQLALERAHEAISYRLGEKPGPKSDSPVRPIRKPRKR